MSFFSEHDRFLETGNSSRRLDARYRALIDANRPCIKGARVLDLASHDGRWAFAAHKAGAAFVCGVEGRADLVKKANENFEFYNVPPDTYQFVCGEALESMREISQEFDTVFLFGIYYHIHNHLDWVREIRRLGGRKVIIDTAMTPCEGEFDNVIRYKIEDVTSIMSSQYETYPGYGFAIAGHPSRAFVKTSFRVFGYSVKEYPWTDIIREIGDDDLKDYSGDHRATFIATRID